MDSHDLYRVYEVMCTFAEASNDIELRMTFGKQPRKLKLDSTFRYKMDDMLNNRCALMHRSLFGDYIVCKDHFFRQIDPEDNHYMSIMVYNNLGQVMVFGNNYDAKYYSMSTGEEVSPEVIEDDTITPLTNVSKIICMLFNSAKKVIRISLEDILLD